MHWSAQARINVLLRNFIGRFLAGWAHAKFQEIVGPRVVAQNYVVFLHFLARLADREWIDQEFMLDATTRTVRLFWGDLGHDGCLSRCSQEERNEVLGLVRETHSDAQLLAALYQYAVESRLLGLEESRLRARDTWTGLLERATFEVTPEALMDSRTMLRGFSPPHGPPPTEIADELLALADFLTRRELVGRVTERLNVRPGSCWFSRENVRLRGRELAVECLTIEDDDAQLSVGDARWILGAVAASGSTAPLPRGHAPQPWRQVLRRCVLRAGRPDAARMRCSTYLRRRSISRRSGNRRTRADDSMLEVLAAAEAAESLPTPPLRSMKST